MSEVLVQKIDKKENYNSVDLFKFICSLLVVILHTSSYCLSNMADGGKVPTGASNGPIITFLLPLVFSVLRIAVPFFFISSSFFLFKKVNKCNTEKEKNQAVKNYCLRILKLYLFWLILSLPYMLDKFLFNSGYDVLTGLGVFAIKIICFDAFDGAWYLGATIFSALFVYLLSKKVKNSGLLVIAIVFYILAVLDSTYFNLFGLSGNSNFMFFQANAPICLSVFNGFVYFTIGKFFAENENRVSTKVSLIMALICFALMYGELTLSNYLGLNYATDCFLALLPFSCFFFQLVINIKLKDKKAYRFIRKSSTFIYLSHFSILYVFFRFVNTFNWAVFTTSVPVMIATYFAVVGLCIGVYVLTNSLSKNKSFAWLKYST